MIIITTIMRRGNSVPPFLQLSVAKSAPRTIVQTIKNFRKLSYRAKNFQKWLNFQKNRDDLFFIHFAAQKN